MQLEKGVPMKNALIALFHSLTIFATLFGILFCLVIPTSAPEVWESPATKIVCLVYLFGVIVVTFSKTKG